MALRDRLRTRQLPQATVGIRIDWSQESYSLHLALEQAKARLDIARERGESAIALTTEVDQLRAQVDAQYEYVTIKALPAAEMEAIVSANPPTDEQKRQQPTLNWNPETFLPAILAATVEGPETTEDWTEMIRSGELVMGEVNTLVMTALELNDRSPSVSLGKGSTTTLS